jgi:hypothetical protein
MYGKFPVFRNASFRRILASYTFYRILFSLSLSIQLLTVVTTCAEIQLSCLPLQEILLGKAYRPTLVL